jgi:putative endonuclease
MHKEYKFFVYILTNYKKSVFYVGFTNNLARRIIEHKNGCGCEFTKKYQVKYLVYFEEGDNVYSVIEREKEVKKWRREKKLDLIKSVNPNMIDLSGKIFELYGVKDKDIKGIVCALGLEKDK